ncbi:hypothetical protein I3760_10G065300 [Carya illinoinensis]|nr:hypothetical protein I3760_10G065300 [Carya illinoinensis]
MTWCNGQGGLARSWARLDRCFIDSNFMNLFSNVYYHVLGRPTSDHSPLVIDMGNDPFKYSPSPFRFQYMWTDNEDFLSFIKGVWNQVRFGFGLHKFSSKLKRVKVALREWNQRVFGRTTVIIKDLESRIERLDNRLQVCFNDEDDYDFMVSNLELSTWKKREEMRLAHMAKKTWLKDGDQNSKFFHAILKSKYHKRISDSRRIDLHDLSDLVSPVIDDGDNSSLCQDPSLDEVKNALFSIPIDSNPGPDGFGFGFYCVCWDFIKDDLLEAVTEFFHTKSFPRFYTASYIVLIPKVDKPSGFDKFRPISLCSVIYKFFQARGTLLVSHLMYVDDIVIFANDGKSSMRDLIQVLKLYEDWSGQVLSKEKSAIYFSKRIPAPCKRWILQMTGFSEGFFPFKYLGVPIVTSRLKASDLDDFLGKVKRKIAGWKMKLLSAGGRTILLRHVCRVWLLICLLFYIGKYVRGKHLSLVDSNKGTRFWKVIVKSVPDILNNSQWLVKDGNVSFWYDTWDDDGPLHDHYQVIDKPLLKIKKCHIDKRWDIPLLERLVGHQKTTELVHFFATCKKGQDVLIWKNDTAGNFNTKLAWDCIRVRAPILPWAHWIWHAILPKNISILMWKATNNCLTVDDKISNSSYTRIIYGLIPSIVSWKLWARRCKARLKGKEDTSESVWSSIRFWICHLMKGSIKQLRLFKQDGDILRRLDIPVPPSPLEKVTMVKWIKPQQGWVKLNIDGSSLGNPGQSGVGGVIRDTRGHLCIAYSMALGQGSNNYVELKGLLEGVRRCCQYGFFQVYIEVDSQLLVNWVTKGACNIWYLEDFLDELRACLACLDHRLTHVFRESNVVADFHAKQGVGGLTWDWFDEKEDLPSQLRGLLRMDRIGLPYLRLSK